MPRSLRHTAVVAALASPLALFVVLYNVPSLDQRWQAPTLHFYIVSSCTVLSAAIGSALALSVKSVRTTRTVFLALGFIAVAMVFATHGLSTPGFIVPVTDEPYAVAISAGLSEVIGASFIFLSVLPARWPGARVVRDHGQAIMTAAFFMLLGYVFVAMFDPERLDIIPMTRRWEGAFAAATLVMLGFSGWRYWRSWRLTELPGQFAMVAALVLLAESQVSMYFGHLWMASWWLYHFLMFAAFSVLIAGWVTEAVRARSLIAFARALELRDGLDRVTLADPESLEVLEAAVERKDSYTRHHMGRVAEFAVAIAREMGLDARTIDTIEIAGRIHDVGKITVPDAVLLKPGKLTAQEYAQMKHHAARGEHIARSSKVLKHVALAVRAHHERYDGRGYPDGLAGEEIPLEARVIAVADTFDALTSTRVYRTKRPMSDAIAEIARVSGTQLDPVCVAAFMRYLAREKLLPEGGEALAA